MCLSVCLCICVFKLISNHLSIVPPCMIHHSIGLSCILCNVTFPMTLTLTLTYLGPKNYNMLITYIKFANRLRGHYRLYSLLCWWTLFSLLFILSYLSWMYIKIDGCKSPLLLPQQWRAVRSFGIGTWPRNGVEARNKEKWKLSIKIYWLILEEPWKFIKGREELVMNRSLALGLEWNEKNCFLTIFDKSTTSLFCSLLH